MRPLRPHIIDYVRVGHRLTGYLGALFCRYGCGAPRARLGLWDLTDGVWLWPEGLVHYLEVHGLALPDAFLARAERNQFAFPARALARLQEEHDLLEKPSGSAPPESGRRRVHPHRARDIRPRAALPAVRRDARRSAGTEPCEASRISASAATQRPSASAAATCRSPCGVMRPAFLRRATCPWFTWLQMPWALRGVKRCTKESASCPFRSPSIQPQHSATSRASWYVTVGFPVAFL